MHFTLKVDLDLVNELTAKTADWNKALELHAEQCKAWVSSKKGLVN